MSKGINRALAERFARALGHTPGPWEKLHAFMDDLYVAGDHPGTGALPEVAVTTCTRCGQQLPDDPILARYSQMLTDWCPWLLIIIDERRAEAARLYRLWCEAIGQEPQPWSGEDTPIPTPDPFTARPPAALQMDPDMKSDPVCPEKGDADRHQVRKQTPGLPR